MIGAGVNAKALAQYMGHSSIKLTFDLYGHLMQGRSARRLLCSTSSCCGPISAPAVLLSREPRR